MNVAQLATTRRTAKAFAPGRPLPADLLEQFGLEGLGAVLGREDLRLVPLQFVGDVAFGVLEGLLADVVVRDLLAVGVGDLDVVAEDLVEPHLQVRHAGAAGLFGLVAGQPALPVGADAAEAVQLGVEAAGDHATVAQDVGAVGVDRPLDEFRGCAQPAQRRAGLDDQVRGAVPQGLVQPRQQPQRLPQRHQLPRAHPPQRDRRGDAVDLRGLGEQFAHGRQTRPAAGELFHGVLARDDRAVAGQRERHPPLQQPGAHPGAGPVDARQQAAGPLVGPQRPVHLQAAERVAVEGHVVGAVEAADRPDVPQGGLLRLAEVLDDRPCG